MKLYRDFYSYTGHSFKEYIRKRRLSNALSLVQYSDMRLIDIAYNCGYSSQQAFCRAIKKQLDITITQYKESNYYFYYPMFSHFNKKQISVMTEIIHQTISVIYSSNKLKGVEDKSLRYLFSIFPVYNGRIFGRNTKQVGNKFCYEIRIEYSNEYMSRLITSLFTMIKIIPEWQDVFAKTKAFNNDDDINHSWDYLYTDWLSNSMFMQNSYPYFEEYIHKNGFIKKLVLYIPVQRKMDNTSINICECDEMLFLVSKKKGKHAEEEASKDIIEYLKINHPYLLQNANEFYIARQFNICSCGIKLNNKIEIPKRNGLKLIKYPKGKYAVYVSGCVSDHSLYEKRLTQWTQENGLFEDINLTFCTYRTEGNFEQKDITTRTYIKIKDEIK